MTIFLKNGFTTRSAQVAIIGGGPAGSVAATRLAQRGIDVIVIEREKFPRFHIGESLLPNGNHLLKEIGVWDKISAAGFIEKKGGQFTLGDRSRTVRNIFSQGLVRGLNTTFQVERSRFDAILLRHAEESGAQVWEEAAVDNAQRVDGCWRLSVSRKGQKEYLKVDWIIDASGRHCFMGRTLDLAKSPLPYPGRAAIFNHFENVARDSGDAAGDTIVLRLKDAWFWSIPISATVTSVGVVLQKNAKRQRGESRSELFWRKVSESSFMQSALAEARPVSDFHIESDYSFSYEKFGAEQTLLTGDAASFIDPVFSSGVYLAMESGLLAADSIADHLSGRRGMRNLESIYASYTRTMKRQIGHMRQLIDAYYDQHSFEVFMSPRPVLQLPQAINSVLAGNLSPSFAVRWRLWLFGHICRWHKRRALVPEITWSEQKPAPVD